MKVEKNIHSASGGKELERERERGRERGDYLEAFIFTILLLIALAL